VSETPAPAVQGESKRLPGPIVALLVSLFLTSFASVGQVTILGKQVFDMTHRPFDLGMLGLAEFLPAFVLAPITGSVADSFDRRMIYAWALAGEAVFSLGLLFYVATKPTSLLPIYGLVVGFGVARAFVAPTSRALPIDLSPPHLLERVVALRSLSFQAGTISGPVVFGLVFLLGPQYPSQVAALGFLAAAVALLFIGPVEVARLARAVGYRQAFRDATDGLRLMRRSPVLSGAISLDLFAVLLGGAVALLPAIAEERLHVGSVGLGWLRAVIGVGAALTAVGLSVKPLRRKVGPVLLAMVALFGLATIVLGLTRSFAVACAALFVLSGADAVSVFVRATLVPLATPESMRGRVLAVENVFIGASNELGAVESGLAAQWLGLVPAVVIGGLGTIAVVGLFCLFVPALRTVDRFAEVRPA
jgi:MFS family permease